MKTDVDVRGHIVFAVRLCEIAGDKAQAPHKKKGRFDTNQVSNMRNASHAMEGRHDPCRAVYSGSHFPAWLLSALRISPRQAQFPKWAIVCKKITKAADAIGRLPWEGFRDSKQFQEGERRGRGLRRRLHAAVDTNKIRYWRDCDAPLLIFKCQMVRA